MPMESENADASRPTHGAGAMVARREVRNFRSPTVAAGAEPRHPRGIASVRTREEKEMRRLVQSALLLVALIALASTIQPAAAAEVAKYCLQGTQWGYPGNCQFATYQQCMATASGTDSGCGINPGYAYARQRTFAPRR
jgi:hypothetical protein